MFVPNNQTVTRQDVSNNNKKNSCPNAPPPQIQQNNVAQPIDTVNAQVCYTKILVKRRVCVLNLVRTIKR